MFYRMLERDPQKLRGACIVLFGAGGKTGLLNRLSHELSGEFDKVVRTSLTKSAFHPHEKVLLVDELTPEYRIEFESRQPLFIMHPSPEEGKLQGLSEAELRVVLAQSDVTVVEGDGARKMSLKVHSDGDPAVPGFATHVIIIIGADGVGQTVQEGPVHRKREFCRHWGVTENFLLTPQFMAEVVTSEKGYLRKIPPAVRKGYFINKAEEYPEQAERLARAITQKTDAPVFTGSVRTGSYQRIPHK